MRWILITVVVVTLGVMAYVRLAPSDLTKVHTAGDWQDIGDYPTAGGFTAVRALATSPQDALKAIAAFAGQTKRTQVLAGSVEEGTITFETRSRIMGFPDHTTVSIVPEGAAPGGNAAPLLIIYGRLRFGSYDLGVNRARIKGWLAQLGPVVAAS